MTIRAQHWDVFTRVSGKGNPAGIVLAADHLGDPDMQAIAKAIGFNDTAFVLPSPRADVRIRYFAPAREVDLCAHATIVAVSALHRGNLLPKLGERQTFTLETRAGVLTIGLESSDDGHPVAVMNQGTARFAHFGGSRSRLAAVLGVSPTQLHSTLPIVYGSTGRWTLVVPMADLQSMQRLRPEQAQFAAILEKFPDASIHPFCRETIDPRACMHARHFSSAASGTLEDAVTGTASGVLGAYYNRFIADRADPNLPLTVEQGYEVEREGTVQVWAINREHEYVVRIAGSACFVRDLAVECG